MTTETVSGLKIRKGEKTIRHVCTVRTVEGYTGSAAQAASANVIPRSP